VRISDGFCNTNSRLTSHPTNHLVAGTANMSRRWIETSRASSYRPVRLGVGCEIDQNARNFAASYLQSTVRGSSMRACLVGLPLLCCSSLCGAPPPDGFVEVVESVREFAVQATLEPRKYQATVGHISPTCGQDSQGSRREMGDLFFEHPSPPPPPPPLPSYVFLHRGRSSHAATGSSRSATPRFGWDGCST
jgi:hypothetical protein